MIRGLVITVSREGSGVRGVVNVITNYFDLYSDFFGEFRFLIHI